MAGSLEFAKLVVASLLYQYWDTINKWLRTYLAVACFVLMIITSGGIYGFLSGAYQSTATQSELLDKSLAILNQKQIRFEETKEDLSLEKIQVNKSISDLRIALSNPTQIQYIDKESGTLITTSSSSARRALQSELSLATTSRDGINIKIEAVMDSINATDMALLNKEISNENESELGPLKYLAETTGKDMNQVVNWFLLLIIFVFDPLAIALVVAANMAFAQIREPEDPEEDYFVARNKHIEEITIDGGDIEVTVEPTEQQMKEIKIEPVDIVVDDMEEISEGKRFARGLGAVIDVLEDEEREDEERKGGEVENISSPVEVLDSSDLKISPDPTIQKQEVSSDTAEHNLYHGSTEEGSSSTVKRIKRNARIKPPKTYRYKG